MPDASPARPRLWNGARGSPDGMVSIKRLRCGCRHGANLHLRCQMMPAIRCHYSTVEQRVPARMRSVTGSGPRVRKSGHSGYFLLAAAWAANTLQGQESPLFCRENSSHSRDASLAVERVRRTIPGDAVGDLPTRKICPTRRGTQRQFRLIGAALGRILTRGFHWLPMPKHLLMA